MKSLIKSRRFRLSWGALLALLLRLFLFTSVAEGAAVGEDPVLKILLFQTKSQITVKSSQGISIYGVSALQNHRRPIRIHRMGAKKVGINERWAAEGSVWVTSNGLILVSNGGSGVTRRYEGALEIRPEKEGLLVINHVRTETYLEGVLNAEISTRWHPEVVKAQTVIARTYALHRRSMRENMAWHLSAGAADQVYQGANVADRLGRDAIRSTQGLVVTYEGKLAQTFYHSNCGGVTEDPGNLWNTTLPYLKAKKVPYGQEDPKYNWSATIPNWEIQKILRKMGHKMGTVRSINITERTDSERAHRITFDDGRKVTLKATDFRRLAGYSRIQSLLFDVVRVPRGFYFEGTGNGHGVGLCQWGAKEMAEHGYQFDEILHYFYTGVQIEEFRAL